MLSVGFIFRTAVPIKVVGAFRILVDDSIIRLEPSVYAPGAGPSFGIVVFNFLDVDRTPKLIPPYL